jgi:hypothetical protein
LGKNFCDTILFTGFSLHSLVTALRDDVAFLEAISAFELPQFFEDVFEIVNVDVCVVGGNNE